MNTIELSFNVQGGNRDVLIALLSESGFEAFEETEDELRAYVPENAYDTELKAVVSAQGYYFTEQSISPQNWNATWEASFDPVIVPGFCTIRADFHTVATETPYEVIVTPKMSFGTGHHATTRLMVTAMKDIDFKEKAVIDFGTGTGILAILAAQLGAATVLAVDNDEWSVENALENVAANHALKVTVKQGSLEVNTVGALYDIILANINRHILLQYMAMMHAMIKGGGILLLSGILTGDEQIVSAAAENTGLEFVTTFRENGWTAMKFTA